MTQRTEGNEHKVEWPKTVVSTSDSDDDLGPPLAQLLEDLDIKGNAADTLAAGRPLASITGTPDSVSILEAGATAASKGWAAAILALGGGTAVWAAVTEFWDSEEAIRGNLVFGAAIIIAASTLAIGLIMYGDLRARGQGAAAQYHARAEIAAAFLSASPSLISRPAPSVASTATPAASDRGPLATSEELRIAVAVMALAEAGESGVLVKLRTGGRGLGRGAILSDDGVWKFRLDNVTWMPISEISGFGLEE